MRKEVIKLKTRYLIMVLITILGISIGYSSLNTELRVSGEATIKKQNFASYLITDLYENDGKNNLYYHDGTGNYINANYEAADYSYRFSGANPNNFVCFGSNEEICPLNNLYRIIGIFNGRVKLIKYTTYGNYAWDTNRENIWFTSDIKTSLENYYFLFDSYWQNLIDVVTWKVGGTYGTDKYNVKDYFQSEIVENDVYDEFYVGLMYVTDYGYASSPENWNTALIDYNVDLNIKNNWLYFGAYEWTISRFVDSNDFVFGVNASGYVSYGGTISIEVDVRPCFYLKKDVSYLGGNGTKENPYRVVN